MPMLGASGIAVPKLCLGGNVFGWTVRREAAFGLLDRAVAEGLSFIDTADVYSYWIAGNEGGESEAILGEWLERRGRRDDVVIATKVGHDWGREKGRLTRGRIRLGIEESLRRLRTDHVDLYYAHVDDLQTPMAETLGAFGELVAEGKVRAIGASNFAPERLAGALEMAEREGLPRYAALQPLYNLYARDGFEGALRDVAKAAGLAVMPYYALARGFLTGKYRSEADLAGHARGGGNAQYLNPRGMRILEALDAAAAAEDATPAEVALAWLMAQQGVTAPVASATSEAQVESLVRATRLELGADSLARLDAASAPG
jgi:aryl-alcohol dehydrogenase-like predicted oxidoreductase